MNLAIKLQIIGHMVSLLSGWILMMGKDGNEYWYGTNEKNYSQFTEEEDNELGGSYDTNNWGKMPADIEAGLEWMEAFDDLRDLNSIVVGTIGYDVNDVLKAEKERDNATENKS